MPIAAEFERATDAPVKPPSVERQLARNTGWTVAGSVSSQGASLLSALVIGRLLGVAPLGKLALIQATVVLLGNIAEMGLALTTTKFVSRWRTADPARAGRLLGWTLRTAAGTGALVAVGVALFAPWLGIGGLSSIAFEIRAACGMLLFDMLNRIQLGALAGLEAFDRSARVQAARGVLLLPAVYLGARWGGLIGVVAAMSCVSLAVWLVGHRALAKRCRELAIPICYRGSREPGVVVTSLSLWGGALLLSGSTWAVTLMLASQTGGFSQVGIYNAADKWKIALTYLPNMLFQVTLPMLSHRQAAGDHPGCRRIFHVSLASTLAVSGTAALAVAFLARPLMSSYGPAFTPGARVLTLLAAGAVAGAVYTVGSSVLWALGRPAQMLGVDIFKTLILLVLCWAGLASSAWNLALAYLLAYAAGGIVIMLAVRRQLGAKQWAAQS
jgi:O-antigen/teichoic acid export membrane protein